MKRITAFALSLLLALSCAFAGWTEFYTTKGAGASDLNGGGPQLGADDGPVYTTADASVIAGALTTVVDNSGGNWKGVLVDCFITIDTAGTKEIRRVSALAPGGDATKITISAAATACANKAVRCGGAWTTIDFAASTITLSTVNAAADPPRGNIKYSATAYDEQVQCDTSGTSVGIYFEGYETTAGDGCPNGNLPLISSSATALAGGFTINVHYIHLLNLRIEMTGAGIEAINAASSYSVFENLRLKATGAGADGLLNTGSSVYGNIWVEDSAAAGFNISTGCLMYYCRSTSAGTYGFLITGAYFNGLYGCIADTPGDDGFAITGYPFAVVGCTAYGSVAGSGIRYNFGAYGAIIKGNLLVSNNQYGIEALYDPSYLATETYNAFYANGVNEVKGALPRIGAGTHLSLNSITLTGDPFTNAAAGNFALNATAGAGAACRAAGFPGTLRDGTNIGKRDIGPLQHADPVGGGGIPSHLRGGHVQ